MKIYSINNTVFTSNHKVKKDIIQKISKDKSFTEIKPIKNYYQYMKEYGLAECSPKKIKTDSVVKKDTI